MKYSKARRELAKGLEVLFQDNNYQEYKLQNLCKKIGLRLVNYKVNFCPTAVINYEPTCNGTRPAMVALNYPTLKNRPRRLSAVGSKRKKIFNENRIWATSEHTLKWIIVDYPCMNTALSEQLSVADRRYQVWHNQRKIGSISVNMHHNGTKPEMRIKSYSTYNKDRSGLETSKVPGSRADTSRVYSIAERREPRDPFELLPAAKYSPKAMSNFSIRYHRELFPAMVDFKNGIVMRKLYFKSGFNSDKMQHLNDEFSDTRESYERLPRELKEFEWNMKYA